MAKDLVHIFLGKSVQKLEAQAAKYSPSLVESIRDLGAKSVREVSEIGLASYMSASPVDTFELRGLGFNQGYLRREYTKTKASVIVTSDIHIGRDRRPQSAETLVDILNSGTGRKGKTLRRSQNSVPVGIYGINFPSYAKDSSTAGWLGKAEKNFRNALLTYTAAPTKYTPNPGFNPTGVDRGGRVRG